MNKLWVVRSNNGEFIEQFLDDSVVALNWLPDENLTNKDLQTIKLSLKSCYPGREKSIPAWASMINNFVNKMNVGDFVLTYDPSSRLYYIGEICGNYDYQKNNEDCPHIRKVKWNGKILRDRLSNEIKNSLGSTLTVFQLKNEQEENKENSRMLIENAKENLKDAIQSLDAEEMEELFKEILNAMGYIAERSKKGADRGIDIFASKDGLGLEDPRIFVEVKHRNNQMGAQDIRTFIGGRQAGDKCLYVSTGGFTKEARYEAERSNIPLKLIDIEDLANLVSLHYDKFSAEGKILLPLKKVYLPLN